MMQFDKAVILVGQGEVNESRLTDMARHHPIIALDGGLQKLERLGLEAEWVIGDMDSIPQKLASNYADKMIKIDEQDSNDFEKALYAIKAPLFIGFGLLGGRFDQVMATLHGMIKYHLRKKLMIVSAYEVLICVMGQVKITLPADCACAILPIRPISFSSSSGLRWPVDGLRLEIGGTISSSNHLIGTELVLVPDDQDMQTPYLISCAPIAIDSLMRYLRKC